MLPEIKSTTLPCARCGQPAAIFTLFPAGTGEELWRERDHVKREEFLGSVYHFGDLPALTALLHALRDRDYDAARGLAGPDLIAFHCWECAADYCESCWRIGPPEYDEDFPGFYDCTHGTCPAGHTQVVDD